MRALSAAVTVAALGISGVAAAEDAEPFYAEEPTDERAAPAGAEETSRETRAARAGPEDAERDEDASGGAERHDGFYLRGGIGFGGLVDQLETGNIFFNVEGEASGPSVGGLLAAGYTVTTGLVVGGFFGSESVTDPEVTIEGVMVDADVSVGTLVMIGALIDWYPNARGGFHLMGGIGAASIRIEDDAGNVDSEQPVGGGGFLGIGYDFWVADEWSLGILARGTGAGLRGDEFDHRVSAGSLMFVATYH